ncbi:hypothetical protein J437_LFUL019116, partial [Ladona fulva]
MDELLQGIDCTGTLLDDIIITSPTRQEHLQNLSEVLKRLKQARLCLKLAKCWFMQKSQGIHPTEEKVEAIKKTPTPRNVKDLRAFLGSIDFHEHFIPQLHACCADLHHLISKQRNQATVVPYDETRPLVLACDASEHGVGVVLFQTMGVGQDQPITYASRTLTEVERHYAPIDQEALVLVFVVGKFHNYLWGRPFKLKTDHKPLERIFGEKPDLSKVANRLQHWALYLNEYNYKVEYQPGKENQCADALFWLPMPTAIKSLRDRKFFLLSYRNTPHATIGKAPDELFLGRRLPTLLDHLKPDPRNKMEIEVWKQKVYHEANVRVRSFRQGDEVWVKNECKPGWHPGVVERRTGKLSFEVLI